MTLTICLFRQHGWLTLLRFNPLLCFSFTAALLLSGWSTDHPLDGSVAVANSLQADEKPSALSVIALASNPVPERSDRSIPHDSSQFVPLAVIRSMAAPGTQSSEFRVDNFRLVSDGGAIARSWHETPEPKGTLDQQQIQPQPVQAGAVQSPIGRSSLLIADSVLADSGVPAPSEKVLRQGSEVLGVPSVQLQGVFKQEGDDTSARARVRGFYPVTPNAGFGAEVDLTTGRGFSDSQTTGLSLNELYFAGSLPSLPTLRVVVGLMDLTSYFDRNSFAKDGATHFFNSVFQTNPALAAAGISSRPGLLVNWSVTDDIDLKATTFSSTRNLGDFHLDAFAGEVGVRFGTAIIRGTYVSSRDAGQRSGFREIFDIPRLGRTGPQPGDREEAYGINGEFYIPALKLGLFGRYGHYTNLALDTSGTTYSAGLNFLDVFSRDDRLGLGYGRQLSNDDLRRARGDKNPDVLELFYDFRITPNLRAAVMIQERNEFTETVLGVRVRTDFDISSLFRRSR